MSNTQTLTRSPSISTPKIDRTKKTSKIAVLRLPPELLARFIPKPTKQESATPASDGPTPSATTTNVPTLKVGESTDAMSESNSTPAPAQDSSNPADPPKKRKGPAPGTKRNIGLSVESMTKPRGKPGPKKKPRLEDGTIDHSIKQPTTTTTATGPAHKLGPKANQGAINAGLRALDRTGTPCRKWTRKPLNLKSFTGVTWELPSWRGGRNMMLANGDDSSDTKEISQQSSSEVKPTESDVAMSNADDGHDPMAMSTPMASSPPPPPTQTNGITA